MYQCVLMAVLVIVVTMCNAAIDDRAQEQITIAGEEFELEVAADFATRSKGLMGREEIVEHGGMIFIFPRPGHHSFWMKNCLVDIDLLYLDSRGRIVSIHEMKTEPPQLENEPEFEYESRLKRYPSRKPAQFAIELKAGSIDRLDLERGQTIEFDFERLKLLAK